MWPAIFLAVATACAAWWAICEDDDARAAWITGFASVLGVSAFLVAL